MEPLKTAGVAELEKFRLRARRARALARISGPDLRFIEGRVDELVARITTMREYSKEGVEVENGE